MSAHDFDLAGFLSWLNQESKVQREMIHSARAGEHILGYYNALNDIRNELLSRLYGRHLFQEAKAKVDISALGFDPVAFLEWLMREIEEAAERLDKPCRDAPYPEGYYDGLVDARTEVLERLDAKRIPKQLRKALAAGKVWPGFIGRLLAS